MYQQRLPIPLLVWSWLLLHPELEAVMFLGEWNIISRFCKPGANSVTWSISKVIQQQKPYDIPLNESLVRSFFPETIIYVYIHWDFQKAWPGHAVLHDSCVDDETSELSEEFDECILHRCTKRLPRRRSCPNRL